MQSPLNIYESRAYAKKDEVSAQWFRTYDTAYSSLTSTSVLSLLMMALGGYIPGALFLAISVISLLVFDQKRKQMLKDTK